MKTKLTKEQTLKAILFVTVATTISWPTASLHQSIDLASEVISVDNAAPQPSDDAKPLSMSPDTMMLPVGKLKVPKKPAPLGKNMNPISKKPLLLSKGKVTVCNVPLDLILAEKTDGRSVRTEVIVREAKHPGGELIDFPDVLVLQGGSFADNGVTKESIHKANFEILKQKIEKAANDKLAEIGRCEDVTGASAPQGTVPETTGVRDDASAIADCMIDARTHRALRSADVLQCNINKLDKLGRMDDGDARNSSRVSRELSHLIKNGIYPQLRNLLMSSNSDDQSRAQDMIDDLISRVEDLGSTFNISSSQTTALTNSLRGLKAGADAYQRSMDMKQDVVQLRKDIADAKAQGQNGQPGQVPQYLYQQLQELQSRLQSEIAQGPIRELNQYSQYMQARDVKLFTAPYEQIQRDLQAITGQPAGQNGQQQLGPNGQPINGGVAGQYPAQYGPNGQVGPNGLPIAGGVGGVGYGGQVAYGPNGIPISGSGVGISAGIGIGGIGGIGAGIGYGAGVGSAAYGLQGGYAPSVLGVGYGPQAYQAQLGYSNGGIINPALLGNTGSPWLNQGYITNGAFQNNGIAASILPVQYNTTVVGQPGSPFRNGSVIGTGSAFGTTTSISGGTPFGSSSAIIARPPPPPPINPGLYGGGFSGNGYYNRNLPIMPPSRNAPAILPISGTTTTVGAFGGTTGSAFGTTTGSAFGGTTTGSAFGTTTSTTTSPFR